MSDKPAVAAIDNRDGKIWIDGSLLDWRDAKIHVCSVRVLLSRSDGYSGLRRLRATAHVPDHPKFDASM
ncbi:hypothetical protein M0D69_30395 [Caballeronia sp. SEWSISQ10-4 2]|uniref:hypothetical protein n=1 Tax=Caballeronia sp. SEWSISQ10-4 2 TaxID=2937438 RepID=UPI0026553305|nr:hypothetical protein [Caballeronia sp. SEWSISQ10-4 2]MDN7182250.1 hypothetical protein [Caballeronia sp. SEWSISQ10-4 2]